MGFDAVYGGDTAEKSYSHSVLIPVHGRKLQRAGLLPLRRIKKFDMHQAFLRGSCNGRIKRPCAIEFYTDALQRY